MMRDTTAVRSSAWLLRVVMLAALAVALAGVVLVSQRPAEAHDHEVPDTVLKKDGRNLQAGRRVNESSWDRPSGDGCVNQSVIYAPGFPDVDRVAAGSELSVRIFKAQRPDSFDVAAYPKADREGQPAGRALLLPVVLERVVKNGRTVAWDAVFSVNRPDRHYYLVTEGHWQDRQGCGNDQFAFWSFHVKTGSAS